MTKNILVIGNGFDLYHGLRTKYSHFVEWTKRVGQREPKPIYSLKEIMGRPDVGQNLFVQYFQKVAAENHAWIDCEQEIKTMISVVLKALKNEKPYGLPGTLDISRFTREEIHILEELDGIFQNISGTEMKVNAKYIHHYHGINTSMIMDELKSQMDTLIKLLEEYLTEAADPAKIKKRSPQIASIRPSYVISFNYTNTYRLYNIPEEDVFFIHGKIGSNPNNMVLGFEDDDETELDSIYFKKYFQRIQKLTGVLDEKRLARQDDVSNGRVLYGEVISHFFGLSMSRTDGDMIRRIEELSTRMVVYYCNQADYEQKVINLIDVFGKNTAVQKIQKKEIELIQIE